MRPRFIMTNRGCHITIPDQCVRRFVPNVTRVRAELKGDTFENRNLQSAHMLHNKRISPNPIATQTENPNYTKHIALTTEQPDHKIMGPPGVRHSRCISTTHLNRVHFDSHTECLCHNQSAITTLNNGTGKR